MNYLIRSQNVYATFSRSISSGVLSSPSSLLRRLSTRAPASIHVGTAWRASQTPIRLQIRAQSTGSRPLTDRATEEAESELSNADKIAMRKALSPAYRLEFTCKQCLERSGHSVSKQSYHFGTCVIQCPKCKKQHLISDHLKIFSDTGKTLEEIAQEHGEKLRKGRLGAGGDIEFYDEKDVKSQM